MSALNLNLLFWGLLLLVSLVIVGWAAYYFAKPFLAPAVRLSSIESAGMPGSGSAAAPAAPPYLRREPYVPKMDVVMDVSPPEGNDVNPTEEEEDEICPPLEYECDDQSSESVEDVWPTKEDEYGTESSTMTGHDVSAASGESRMIYMLAPTTADIITVWRQDRRDLHASVEAGALGGVPEASENVTAVEPSASATPVRASQPEDLDATSVDDASDAVSVDAADGVASDTVPNEEDMIIEEDVASDGMEAWDWDADALDAGGVPLKGEEEATVPDPDVDAEAREDEVDLPDVARDDGELPALSYMDLDTWLESLGDTVETDPADMYSEHVMADADQDATVPAGLEDGDDDDDDENVLESLARMAEAAESDVPVSGTLTPQDDAEDTAGPVDMAAVVHAMQDPDSSLSFVDAPAAHVITNMARQPEENGAATPKATPVSDEHTVTSEHASDEISVVTTDTNLGVDGISRSRLMRMRNAELRDRLRELALATDQQLDHMKKSVMVDVLMKHYSAEAAE